MSALRATGAYLRKRYVPKGKMLALPCVPAIILAANPCRVAVVAIKLFHSRTATGLQSRLRHPRLLLSTSLSETPHCPSCKGGLSVRKLTTCVPQTVVMLRTIAATPTVSSRRDHNVWRVLTPRSASSVFPTPRDRTAWKSRSMLGGLSAARLVALRPGPMGFQT